MTATEYLESIRRLDVRLRMKEKERACVEQDICSIQAIDYSKDHVSGTHTADIADKIARLDDIIAEIEREWDELINRRAAARRLIRTMPDGIGQDLLIAVYVCGRDIHEVADDMHVSRSQFYRMRMAAIKGFAPYYNKLGQIGTP